MCDNIWPENSINSLKITLNENSIIPIYQQDLNNGTYICDKSAIYQLQEDICFRPNPENDFRPNIDEQEEYNTPAYKLDFFTIFSIQSNNIKFDLNGYTLSGHRDWILQMRWGSAIEIGNTAFIQGQGPVDFGPLKQCNNIWITNGHIGKIPHHGIHGNNYNRVIIDYIDFDDFEVSPIGGNQCQYTIMENCNINSINRNIPVLGNYSALRFQIKNISQGM